MMSDRVRSFLADTEKLVDNHELSMLVKLASDSIKAYDAAKTLFTVLQSAYIPTVYIHDMVPLFRAERAVSKVINKQLEPYMRECCKNLDAWLAANEKFGRC